MWKHWEKEILLQLKKQNILFFLTPFFIEKLPSCPLNASIEVFLSVMTKFMFHYYITAISRQNFGHKILENIWEGNNMLIIWERMLLIEWHSQAGSQWVWKVQRLHSVHAQSTNILQLLCYFNTDFQRKSRKRTVRDLWNCVMWHMPVSQQIFHCLNGKEDKWSFW